MSGSGSPSSPRAQPHITLNSGNQDVLVAEANAEASADRRPAVARQDTSRSLIPPRPQQQQQQQRAAPPPPLAASQQTPPSSAGYGSPGFAESAELLLPPKKSRTHRFRDEDSPSMSPARSGFSSRRTSWSSDAGSRDSRGSPFGSPFDDSRAPSRAGSDDDNVNTQTVSEKYNILPSAGLLLFPEDVEKDDWLHNPDPNDKDRLECDLFSRRGMVNVGGLAFITLGVLFLFIGYPVLNFVQKVVDPAGGACRANPDCIDVGPLPLMKNIRRTLVDPDTPASAKTKTAADGSKLTLVFSDEFNTPGRTFYPDDDPYFEAVDLWYGVTQDLEWYDPDAVTTRDGVLELRFDAFKNHNLNYRSGMVQSWNKLCYKGGLLEASISLPGRGDTIGFWPGFWAMGNLGRPGYASTTDGMWPYSYHDVCDVGITKNQSTPDGLSFLPGMKMPACTCKGEDHPTPGKSRSAPELDAIEASVGVIGPGNSRFVGSASQSAQFAPFDIWYQPNYDFIEVYDPSITQMNAYRGGKFQQALSGLTVLNNDWYDGKQYQTYAFEYTPGAEGTVVFHVGNDATWKMDARSVGPNGNIGQRVLPEEPMSLIMNFGLSESFAQLDLPGLSKLMPATMRFDYVRIYQDADKQIVSCDPPGYETTKYIREHAEAYYNPNLTMWEDTGFAWPKNTLVNPDCRA
ncbi:MAG: hypothetical protein M1832_004776 [Thelocarpon impressellum]|nr:MAG: hypothetical protein M1832_004776 [Thelocarpon impressellum]